MANKKKITLVENKSNKKMFRVSLRQIKWRKYLIGLGILLFALLLIFGNFKSESYYKKLKEIKKDMEKNNSQTRSIQSIDLFVQPDCVATTCNVSCSGDMTFLNTYLENQTTCSFITLRIFDGYFLDQKLQRNWLKGNFNITSIKISSSPLKGIELGAFEQKTVAYLSELELTDVQISFLSETTFNGLKSIETFSLINRVESFSAEAFLKPMATTLKKLTIQHITQTPTDPGLWLRGENFPKLMTVVFDGSNFGNYINVGTFENLPILSLLLINSCKITTIADGAFDFMMNHMVVLISLQNNQLKKLNGEYISKVTSLIRIDIQNNPWDCSCELEHLVREFKRYPGGFGENSKCASPPEYAGKVLNEVILLDKCDATSASSETTQVSQETSSTNLLTTTNKQISTTPVTSTISSEPISTTTVSTTTVFDGTTTTSTQNRVTTLSADSIFIPCQKYKPHNPPISAGLELSPPDGHFQMISISKTSVKLIFDGPSNDLAVIWFYEQPNLNENGGNIRVVGEFIVNCHSELETSVVIESLLPNQTYTFCLVKNGTMVISPFNCKSYASIDIDDVNHEETVWLQTKDKTLAVGIFIVSMVIAICMGLLGMFLLLRYHPVLLKGSKRVVVVNESIGDVLVIPRPKVKTSLAESSFNNSFNSEATTVSARRFSIKSNLSYLTANHYEDIEYRWKMNARNDMIYANRVPTKPAPSLPNRNSGHLNPTYQKPDTTDKSAIKPSRSNDYGYI